MDEDLLRGETPALGSLPGRHFDLLCIFTLQSLSCAFSLEWMGVHICGLCTVQLHPGNLCEVLTSRARITHMWLWSVTGASGLSNPDCPPEGRIGPWGLRWCKAEGRGCLFYSDAEDPWSLGGCAGRRAGPRTWRSL